MANLNNPLCATSYGNTGFGECFLEPAEIKGAIQVTAGFEIAEADLEDLQTFLETKVHAAIGTRIFPYHGFINITDNTEDVSITTTDYGAKYVTRDGFYDMTFRYLKGGVQLHQEISKNGGSGKYFLFYDKNGVLYGYLSGGKLKGIPIDIFYVNPWRFATGADVPQYLLRFIIDPVYLNKGNLGFVKVSELETSFNLFDVTGLQDLKLTILETNVNVATVKVESKISNVNLYDAYSTNLAQTAAWKAFNPDDTASSVTNVATNASLEAFDVTVDPDDFEAAFDGELMKIQLNAPSILKAAPILVSGFEDKDGVDMTVASESS